MIKNTQPNSNSVNTHRVKYKAVLFDMDGVIIDSEPLHEAAFRATFDARGRQLTGDHYKQYFLGKTDRDGLELYFKFMNEQVDVAKLADEKALMYLQLASDQITAYPGVVPLIKSLSAQVPLALVTGSLSIEAETALAALGIRHCFTTIVSAEDVAAGKPNPEGYLKAARLLGVAAKDCVVVEDSASGAMAAKAAGADCIAVTNTHTEDEPKEATTVVGHLSLELF